MNPEPPTANPTPLIWGQGLEPEAVNQMLEACRLPVSLAGALMPDAHIGYGLPIGGVLATDNSVIPYGVGVDIAAQTDLVEVLGRFDPKLVKMCPAGDQAED